MSYGLCMPSVTYAQGITQTSSNIKIANNTHGFQECCNKLSLVLAYGDSLTPNKS